MREIAVKARAKINLTLFVTGRRPDGYHEIDSIMASVDLSDDIRLVKTDGGVALRVRGDAPSGDDNLASRAARLLEPLGRGQGVSIELIKGIPAMAGLGGGSADAAAVLAGLDRLWDLRLPREELARHALSLGADVPFMLTGGLARCRGVGESVEAMRLPFNLPMLIVMGGAGLSTACVYRALDERGGPFGQPDGKAGEAIRRGDARALAGSLRNALEDPARDLGIPVDDTLRTLARSGALGARMSGSGAAFYGIYPDMASAERARETLSARFAFCRAASACPEGIKIVRETP